MARQTNFRFRSVRSYRRYLEQVMREAFQGKRPMSDISKAAAGAKAGAELFMAEHMLERAGCTDEVELEKHEALLEGSRQYREQTVTVEQGIGKDGQPVEKTKAVVTGSADEEGEMETVQEAAEFALLSSAVPIRTGG
jgi:hypothetical protein